MNIYHSLYSSLRSKVYEVLRQRISKRYSKRHFYMSANPTLSKADAPDMESAIANVILY